MPRIQTILHDRRFRYREHYATKFFSKLSDHLQQYGVVASQEAFYEKASDYLDEALLDMGYAVVPDWDGLPVDELAAAARDVWYRLWDDAGMEPAPKAHKAFRSLVHHGIHTKYSGPFALHHLEEPQMAAIAEWIETHLNLPDEAKEQFEFLASGASSLVLHHPDHPDRVFKIMPSHEHRNRRTPLHPDQFGLLELKDSAGEAVYVRSEQFVHAYQLDQDSPYGLYFITHGSRENGEQESAALRGAIMRKAHKYALALTPYTSDESEPDKPTSDLRAANYGLTYEDRTLEVPGHWNDDDLYLRLRYCSVRKTERLDANGKPILTVHEVVFNEKGQRTRDGTHRIHLGADGYPMYDTQGFPVVEVPPAARQGRVTLRPREQIIQMPTSVRVPDDGVFYSEPQMVRMSGPGETTLEFRYHPDDFKGATQQIVYGMALYRLAKQSGLSEVHIFADRNFTEAFVETSLDDRENQVQMRPVVYEWSASYENIPDITERQAAFAARLPTLLKEALEVSQQYREERKIQRAEKFERDNVAQIGLPLPATQRLIPADSLEQQLAALSDQQTLKAALARRSPTPSPAR